MPKIAYMPMTMGGKNLSVVSQANEIIVDYRKQGYKLTLRQLYYQFVSRDWLANTVQNYKRLGEIVNDGRLQGLIDWDAIEDRTRNLERVSAWENPQAILEIAASNYQIDMWENQDTAIEVWVEKEALAGVIEKATKKLRVPYLSCRGYTSQSEMWLAGRRLARFADDGKGVVIIHLGDHDPSGIDMSRDIQDRLKMFMGENADALTFRRIALNMDQVVEYHPPPNPAKTTDSRYNAYQEQFGIESWELDALNPATLDQLISDAVQEYIDEDQWQEDSNRESEEKEQLAKVSNRWDDVCNFLSEDGHEYDKSEREEH